MTQHEESQCGLQPTEMLYYTYEGNSLTECDATVMHVEKQDDECVNVCLDRTVFHAQGGGQPTDKGIISKAKTNDDDDDDNDKIAQLQVAKVVQDRDTGIAHHSGKFVSCNSNDNTTNGKQGKPLEFQVGDAVHLSVDKDLRRILSECHTAGHVVDSAMSRCGKFLKPSKAYHFLEGPYVEYEGSMPSEERDGLLKELQGAFCELVSEKIDTKIELMSKEQADAVCNRQAQNFDMDIFADKDTNQVRVVTVAGFPCPCGGTHVLNTADLEERKWGITGIKSKKGAVRVKYGYSK